MRRKSRSTGRDSGECRFHLVGSTMLPEATTNQLIAARHLYYLAEQNIRSEQTASLFAGINLLQDAVEAFLWAAGTSKDVLDRERLDIHQIFDAVSASLRPQALPFRPAITQLNRLRINSKHYGISPDRKEAQRLLVDMAEFLREATALVFADDFWAISLIHLLSDELQSVKYWLFRAEQDFHECSFQNCLIHCRYSLYLEFEQLYDISPYVDSEYINSNFFGFRSLSPSWALNTIYINDRVAQPCDFIVINYDDLHRRLWENGIDATVFWNVRRLTPEVFFPRERNEINIKGERARDEALWVVKHDFNVLDDEGIEDRAAYVLRHTVEMILGVSNKNQQMKAAGRAKRTIKLKAGDIPYYTKASRTAEPRGIIPREARVLDTSCVVRGLDSDELFWEILYFNRSEEERALIFGFIGNDDVEGK